LRESWCPAAVVAVLISTNSPEAEPQLREVQTAAHAIGRPIHILNASTERDVDTAFATNSRTARCSITNDAFFIDRSEQLVALAGRQAVPTIYDRRAYAAAGGLVSYGAHYVGAFRQLAGRAVNEIRTGNQP
jgi:putative ABC transport system substrate-binding protein